MKVLHIIDSGGLYGTEMVLLNLAEEQKKQGLDVTIASIGEKRIHEKPVETEAIKRRINVEKFRMFPGPNFFGMSRVLKFAQNNKFDIMHSHGYKGNVSFGFIPKKLRKLPLISTLHGYTSTDGLSKNRIYEWFDLKSLKYIDAVVLVNKGMLANPRLNKIKGITFHVINNGIPVKEPVEQTQVGQQAKSAEISLDEEIVKFCSYDFIIGTLGRLSQEKGHHYLIDSLKLLLDSGINARVVIIGEGPERSFLERRICELGLTESVIMPGYKSEARKYLSLFDVFILPSLTEGLPITLLEAMDARVPIVSSDVGGVGEILEHGDAGVLVKPADPHALAEGINRFINKPEFIKRLTDAAYNMLVTRYSSKTMANEYLSIYEDILSRNTAFYKNRMND